MKKRHGEVISKTGLIIGLLSLSLVAIAGQANAAIQCYDCHGDRQAGVLKPKDTSLGAPKLRDETTGAFLGNHQTHLGAAPTAADCVKCHNNQNYTNSHATAGNFQIQINPKLNNFSTALGSARYGKPTFFNQTTVPQTSNCSNVNCHFVSKPSDQWGTTPYASADATTCNKCHDALPTTYSHTKHITQYGNDLTACAKCHTDHTAEAKPFQHATSVGRPITMKIAYSGSNNNYLPGQTGRVVGTCSTMYCHSSGQGTTANAATPIYAATAPTWGGTAACGSCHATTTMATGSHTKHLTLDTNCGNCHTGASASSYTNAAHVNQLIDVNSGYTAGGAAGNGYGTCSTASCHDNGTGTSVVTPTWGSTAAACSACHAVQPSTGSHTKHVSTTLYARPNCGSCHTGAVESSDGGAGHLDTNIDVDATTGYPQNKDKGTAYASCATSNCHSSGQGTTANAATPVYAPTAPTWGGTAACGSCHVTTTMTTGSHTKHLTLDTNCGNCHNGASASAYNSTSHVNQQIDVNSGYTAGGAPGNGYGTCSTASCHSDGAGNPVVTPAWGGSTAACSACHAVQPATGSHTKHVSTTLYAKPNCGSCHIGAVESSNSGAGHLDSDIDVDPATGYPQNKTIGSAYSSCATTYCHSSGQGATANAATPIYAATAPTWGGTAACGSCHATTTMATGSHTKHLTLDTNCANCHNGASASAYNSTTHVNQQIDVSSGYTAGGAPGNGYGTCSTATCHDNGRGVAVTTPTWGTTAAACTACHSLQPATGSHTKHLTGLAAFNRNAVCGDCHTGADQGSNGGTQHLDTNVDVASGSGYPQNVTKHNDNNFGTCSTVYCHSNGRGTFNAVQWGNSNAAGCNFCHPNLSATHLKHVTTIATAAYGNTANGSTDLAYDFGCGNCHPVNTSNHMNNSVELSLNSTHGGPLKSKNNVTVDNSGYTQNVGVSVTCSAAYCHSTGFAANLKFIASPDWYGTHTGDKCAMCHGNSPNSDTVNKPGSPAHSAHSVGIHYDDIFDGVSGKYGYYSSATKASAHGDPNQATIISCDLCHTDTVATAAAGKNVNDNNSICAACHSTTSRTPAIKRMAHINGTVDVKFASVNVRSKAQIRDASFSSYSAVWARTSYKVDSGSYDTAKKSLTQATFTAAGVAGQGTCATVSCHNGYTVKWNDSLTCESCHSRL